MELTATGGSISGMWHGPLTVQPQRCPNCGACPHCGHVVQPNPYADPYAGYWPPTTNKFIPQDGSQLQQWSWT